MLGWLDGLKVNRGNVGDMIFKEALVLTNTLERVSNANWKNGNNMDKGILVTRMGIFGKSRGSMHRATVITSLLKERGSGHITGGWFVIHLGQLEKITWLIRFLLSTEFTPKEERLGQIQRNLSMKMKMFKQKEWEQQQPWWPLPAQRR